MRRPRSRLLRADQCDVGRMSKPDRGGRSDRAAAAAAATVAGAPGCAVRLVTDEGPARAHPATGQRVGPVEWATRRARRRPGLCSTGAESTRAGQLSLMGRTVAAGSIRSQGSLVPAAGLPVCPHRTVIDTAGPRAAGVPARRGAHLASPALLGLAGARAAAPPDSRVDRGPLRQPRPRVLIKRRASGSSPSAPVSCASWTYRAASSSRPSTSPPGPARDRDDRGGRRVQVGRAGESPPVDRTWDLEDSAPRG